MSHGLVGQEFGCFCSTQCQRESLSDIKVVADLKGPRRLNSHDWHLGMGSWKAGLSWALSMYLLLKLLTKPLDKVNVILTRWLRASTVFGQAIICFKGARQELQGFWEPSVRRPRASFLSQSMGGTSLRKPRFKEREIRLSLWVRGLVKNLFQL